MQRQSQSMFEQRLEKLEDSSFKGGRRSRRSHEMRHRFAMFTISQDQLSLYATTAIWRVAKTCMELH